MALYMPRKSKRFDTVAQIGCLGTTRKMEFDLMSNLGSQPFVQAARSHLALRIVGYFRFACRNFHWVMTLFLSLALIPAFRIAGLPWRFDWHRYLVDFWLALAVQSLALAFVVYVVLFPAEFVRWINRPPQ